MRPAFTAAGSSPLTRGKPGGSDYSEALEGLIPAHAGKTIPAKVRGLIASAHPRSRGENYNTEIELIPGYGSSPLTRGKPRRSSRQITLRGLIPAHAGKTRPTDGKTRTIPAHPRSRGENGGAKGLAQLDRGSSPLTRGKLEPPFVERCLERLIPAHAGKTSVRVRERIGRRAHPRSRGENGQPPTQARPIYGSSPLTRGKQ